MPGNRSDTRGDHMEAEAMTDKQRDFIESLRLKNGLTIPQLNWFIANHYVDARAASDLSVPEASELIDTMKGWNGAPDDVRRAFGQLDLPGVAKCAD